MLYAIGYWISTVVLIISRLILGIVILLINTALFIIKFTALFIVVGLVNASLFVVTRLFGWKT